jgi:hypothetical protein
VEHCAQGQLAGSNLAAIKLNGRMGFDGISGYGATYDSIDPDTTWLFRCKRFSGNYNPELYLREFT